jgi:hypothetical protein
MSVGFACCTARLPNVFSRFSVVVVDGERCGKTLVDLFAKAKDPDKIFVGLVEQAKEEDTFCIESYCKEMGKYSWLLYSKNKMTIRFKPCRLSQRILSPVSEFPSSFFIF